MSDGYRIASVDAVETLGFRPAGVESSTGDAGDDLVPPHMETAGVEELYVVVRGRATFTVGEQEADARAGTLVFAPGDVFRSAVAAENGTTIFTVRGIAGEAFGA